MTEEVGVSGENRQGVHRIYTLAVRPDSEPNRAVSSRSGVRRRRTGGWQANGGHKGHAIRTDGRTSSQDGSGSGEQSDEVVQLHNEQKSRVSNEQLEGVAGQVRAREKERFRRASVARTAAYNHFRATLSNTHQC